MDSNLSGDAVDFAERRDESFPQAGQPVRASWTARLRNVDRRQSNAMGQRRSSAGSRASYALLISQSAMAQRSRATSALPGSPVHFGTLIAKETKKWGKVVRFAGIKAD
jgi:hypothetical protein